MKRIVISIFFAFILINVQGQEDVNIAYDPAGNLFLGSCIDYNLIFNSKQDCLESTTKEWIDGGAVKTVVSTSFISSHQDISNNFKLSYHSDIKASLNLGDGFEGGGSVDYDFTLNHFFRNISNSIYFVVKAETSHGRLKLKNTKLKSEFQKLLDDGEFSDFTTKCGTHYVRFETRKSSVYAIISISNIEKEIKNQIISKYSASANVKASGFGSVEGNTKVDIDNLFKEISKHGRVEINYLAHGSQGIKSFSPVVSSSSSYKINEILKNLSTALNDFDKERSAPVEYRLASFKPFGLLDLDLQKEKMTFLEKTQVNLNSLFDAYNQIQVIKEIRYDDYLLYYKFFEDEIQSRIKNSTKLLKECYYDDRYDIAKIPYDKPLITKIVWPSNIFTDINIEYNPFYSEGITPSGERKQVLTSISISVFGQIQHSDYFKRMIPLYISPSLELFPTNGFETNENNPSLGTPNISDIKIKTRPFLLRIETFNLDIIPNQNGLITINQEVKDKHKALLSNLNTRKYLVNVETTDGFFYNQLVDFKFMESDIETIR